MFILNLDGKKINKLTIIKTHYIKRKNLWLSLCKCECGKEVLVYLGGLRRGTSKSCGCDRYEKLKTHGKTNCRLYRIWNNMKRRCYTKTNHDYKDYGKRGISLCEDWKNDFNNFYTWAINNGYKDNLTIDRINNDGNYEPSNCRWITNREQQYNKRKTLKIEYKGISKTITQWEQFLGMGRGKLYWRLNKMKMPFEKAIINNNLRHVQYDKI